MAIETYFLVRNGAHRRTGSSDIGRQRAIRTAKELGERGVDDKAQVLSSSEIRAYEMASVIAEILGAPGAIFSRRIQEAGNKPNGVDDLDAWIGQALLERDIERHDGSALVIVTHAPLIRVATAAQPGLPPVVASGEIREYQVGSWQNPDYDAELNAQMEANLA